jgi:NAD(P)-dependent dehydrogenase (short-subunit alcohol dehydrogenase family)
LVLTGWNEKSARAATDELVAQAHKALAVLCDVSDESQVEAMVARTVATLGRLDAAHNNAGVQNVLAEAADSTREDYDRVLAINPRRVRSCMKFELQQMRKQGSGTIVNCSSLGGLVGGAPSTASTTPPSTEYLGSPRARLSNTRHRGQVAEGHRAMDERRAIKTLLRP